MRCEICGKGPIDTLPIGIIRQNLGSLPAVWRCEKHNELVVDAEVQDIMNILQEKK